MKFLRVLAVACLVAGVTAAARAQQLPPGQPEAQFPQTAPSGVALPPAGPLPGPSLVSQMFGGPSGPSLPAACGDPRAAEGGVPIAPASGFPEVPGEGVDLRPEVFHPWYVSLSALVMSRSGANKLWTSLDNVDPTIRLTNTQDIHLPWEWGGELRLGRQLGCGEWTMEGVYWTAVPFEGSCVTQPQSPNLLQSPLTTAYTSYNNNGFNWWFNDSPAHYLWRQDEVHNAEINLIWNRVAGGEDAPWNVDLSLGVRYFRFREQLKLGADSSWLAGRAILDDAVANNLIGAQLGINAEYRLGHGWRLFVAPKLGLYSNLMEGAFDAYVNNPAYRATQSVYPNQQYPVHAYKTDCSFLMEVDLGAQWQITPRWEARLGYRLVAVTGMALADAQIPQSTADMPALADLQNAGSLLLHGAFAGLTYRF